MSDFVEHEAEESDDEELEVKKRKNVISDSSEEDEDDDLDGNLDDLIDDNPVEEEADESGDEGGGSKRGHEDSDENQDLEDEDYQLIEDNTGIKIKRKPKLKRIRRMESDDESDGGPVDERDQLEKELFEGGMEEGEEEEEEPHPPPKDTQMEFGDLDDDGEESDPDDFIVDDEGKPISTKKKKRHIIHDDAALQEAQDIFGVDFDFGDIEDQYDEYYDEEEEEGEDEYEDEEDVDGEATEVKRKQKKTAKRKGKKTTIFEIYEPSELERGHLTDRDQQIRSADMPERFQLRRIPVSPAEERELDEESDWIYKYAFCTPTVSQQDYDMSDAHLQASKRGPSAHVGKIKESLNFMRNQQFEVPFIAFYRKEYVEPELAINDLWKVFHWDEKWMQLKTRKQNLVRLFEKMQQYQFEQIEMDPDKPLESHVRALTQEDVDRVKSVQTMEELRDVYQHFLLYYGDDIPKMKNAARKKQKQQTATEGEDGEGPQDVEQEEDADILKQATRKSGYSICLRAGLAELARKFGLTPEQFGENLRDNYQKHEPEQDPAEPSDLALEFTKGQFRTEDDVMKGARHMVAMQLAAEPVVRQTVRTVLHERAIICSRPTKKGLKLIDESHDCYPMKYLKDKAVTSLVRDQFMKMVQAEEDGLLTLSLHMDNQNPMSIGPKSYYDEIQQLYQRDEFSHLVQEWNNQRNAALERSLYQILYPQLIKELKNKLIEEAKDEVIRHATNKLYNAIKVAPYQADQQLDDDDDYMDYSKGLKVLGLSYIPDRDAAAFCCLVDGDGEVTDFIRLCHLLKRKTSWQETERQAKESDMEKLKDFIASKKPHVIAVSAESREATSIIADIREVVNELEQEQEMAPINIELVDNELATFYANSKKGEQDFREYPHLLRQSVSIARRLQDPLVEFCQLCNPDEDILCLKYHPLQDLISKEEMLKALYIEFINRVNEVGVDVNRCITHPHTAPLVQFVCGLGPRKGHHLLRILKQNNSRLENRTQLVTLCHMGPKVFINCAGFIKIDTNSLGDSTEAYVEVLDGSRVHPETYEWARKMAVDALEYDDTAEDANPAGALEEILESPERLKDLDLDAFAEELMRQGYGDKHITLYDIRAELNHRYKDLRSPFRSATLEEKFNMLTKETPMTFYIGKLVMCRVTGIAHKRPQGDQMDQAEPIKNEETGLWQCCFCGKGDFPELSEVWNHFDAGECPGQAVGVKTRLDNGVTGFIHVRNLSDKKVNHPEERVQVGMTLHCRILKIDIERFQVELTCKSSDLADIDSKLKPAKDPCYDSELSKQEKRREEDKKKQQARQTYIKRVIAHPSFQNIDYKTCEKVMVNMDQGEVIIRPSSKGSDHLTCTWKIADGVLAHIDIKEEGKENAFSLGSSLWIGNEEFEDLDEIIARFVQPMAAFARDIINYKYYKPVEGGKREIMEALLMEEKKKGPSKIPYFICASREYPGKFMLSYLPRKCTKHEFLTVTPEGIRYRGTVFHSLSAVVRWFKEHFRDPIPGTPGLRTPMAITATPGMATPRMETIQRAAAGLPSNVFNTLVQVAGATPALATPITSGATPGQFGGYVGGYQSVQRTPIMTPMMTPIQQSIRTPSHQPSGGMSQRITTPAHQSMGTPQYQPTPRQSHWGGATPSRTPQILQAASSNSSNRGASMDWAKMAQDWAKRSNNKSTHRGSRTPRADQTPMAADATPLFDE